MGEGSGVVVSCGVGHRRGLDPPLLWLWCRLVATAPILLLAWEPPYAVGAALKTPHKQVSALPPQGKEESDLCRIRLNDAEKRHNKNDRFLIR